MLIQPKPYMDKMRHRRHAYGVELRRNMSKVILEKGTPFPKGVGYADIDQAMFDWADKNVRLVYDGKRVPTYKLYSTQRLSEQMQTWNELDESGSLVVNFKTITRENNPQSGDMQGDAKNIPGHRNYAMFYVPVLQENGTDAYDKYTMKQPFEINMNYVISIVSNKMDIVNKMNELMHYEFQSIYAYIAPNGHYMPMTLKEVSDESEYTIDDRKYYSQSYKITVRAYIIRNEDFEVERVPSRLVMTSNDSDASGIVQRRGRNRENSEKVKFFEGTEAMIGSEAFRLDVLKSDDRCEPIPIIEKDKPSEIYEETSGNTDCCAEEEPRYRHKRMRIVMDFDECTTELSFTMDKEMAIDGVETDNVHDFRIIVNGEVMHLDREIRIYDGDEVLVRVTREDEFKGARLDIVGYDPNVVYDSEYNAESPLDEKPTEEEIIVGGEEA